MPQFFVAIHHPDDYDPATVEDEAMVNGIHDLNKAMIAAGVRLFAGGLRPVNEARTLRAQPGGSVSMTDGPFAETKEHIGGFWILECPNLDEALAWGGKAAIACRAPVEVRQFGVPPRSG